MIKSTANGNQDLVLELDDLDLQDILPIELSEETKGHPENLASTKWCCCCISSLPTLA